MALEVARWHSLIIRDGERPQQSDALAKLMTAEMDFDVNRRAIVTP